MLLKKLSVLIFVGCVCTSLTGCSFRLGKFAFFENDKAKANKYTDKIVSALEEKDADKMKALCTNYIREDYDNLEPDIQTMFHYFTGKKQSVEYSFPVVFEENSHGDRKKTLKCGATIQTDKEIYYLNFDYVKESNKERKDEGFIHISLIKAGEEDKYLFPEYLNKEVFVPTMVNEQEVEKRRQKVYDAHPEFFDQHAGVLEHFRVFEEYPDLLDEKPTIFEKYPSLLENIDFVDLNPDVITDCPGMFEDDE